MKIKKFQKGVTAHVGPTPNVNVAMGELERVGQAYKEFGENIGRSVGKVGKAVMDIAEKKNEEKKTRDFYSVVARSEEAWQEFKIKAEKEGVDPDHFFPIHKYGWNSIIEEQEKTIVDPEVRKAFKDRMTKRWLTVMPELTNEANKAWLDREAASKIEQAERFSKLALNSKSKSDYELQKAALQDVFDSAKFIFGDARATQLKHQYLERLDKDRQLALKDQLTTSILKDPTKTISEIMRGEWDELEEAPREVMLEKAKQHELHVMEVREKLAEKERRVNHDNEELGIHRKFATGKLTKGDLLDARFLTADERYTWEQRMIERDTRETVVKNNFREYNAIINSIYEDQPEDVLVRRISSAVDKGLLTERTAEGLLNRVEMRTNSLVDHEMKRAENYLKMRIFKKDMLGRIIETPKDVDRFFRCQGILVTELQKLRRSGKDITEPNLLLNKAMQIWDSEKKSVVERIEEKREEARKISEERRGIKTEPEPLPILPTRNKNESLEDYLKRIEILGTQRLFEKSH